MPLAVNEGAPADFYGTLFGGLREAARAQDALASTEVAERPLPTYVQAAAPQTSRALPAGEDDFRRWVLRWPSCMACMYWPRRAMA